VSWLKKFTPSPSFLNQDEKSKFLLLNLKNPSTKIKDKKFSEKYTAVLASEYSATKTKIQHRKLVQLITFN